MKFRTLRNWLLHKLGVERSYKPTCVINRPELAVHNLLEWAISHRLQESKELRFIQVGGFDGVQSDPLRQAILKFNLTGTIVEPQTEAFQRLRQNYAPFPQVNLVNAAVSHTREKRSFYTVSGATPMASFDKNNLLKHSIPQHQIIEEQVQCVTFTDLAAPEGQPAANLVLIDAEGFDYEILKMIDFSQMKPDVIQYEQHHLSRKDRNQAVRMLTQQGYQFLFTKNDVLAVRAAA